MKKESITLIEQSKKSDKAVKNSQLASSGGIWGSEQEGGIQATTCRLYSIAILSCIHVEQTVTTLPIRTFV